MVGQLCKQTRFYGEGVVEEFSVKVFLGAFTVDTGHTSIVELGTTCPSDHLQQISGLKINVLVRLGIEVLGAFDYDQPSREVNTPGQSGSSYHDLHLVFNKQFLAYLTIATVQASMMQGDTETQGLLEELVVYLREHSL
jgi:hypothetical protein